MLVPEQSALHLSELYDLSRSLASARELDRPDRRLNRALRRGRGAFFTPWPLVEFIVDRTLSALLARRDPSARSPLVVLDPACGDGRFLVSAARWLHRYASTRGPLALRLIGIEREPAFAKLAREQTSAEIICCEALLESTIKRVDAVIGNPPYVRSRTLAHSDPELWRALRGRFAATSYGEWDLYAAFIERAYQWLRGSGEVGLVVPSRWFRAKFARELRSLLARARALSAVVDFGAEQVFADATTYVSVIQMSAPPRLSIAVARRQRNQVWELGQVEHDTLLDKAWCLSVGARRQELARLCAHGISLSKVARVVKGAGTNADRVFVVSRALIHGALATAMTSCGQRIEVERELLRPCLRGRDIPAFPGQHARNGSFCLVPYLQDGRLIPPATLMARFPRAAEYLSGLRHQLDSREGGRFSGERFYCFGRPQNIRLLLGTTPRVVIPDVAKPARALVDRSGFFVLDTAYVVVAKADYPLHTLAAVLSSPVASRWLEERSVPLRGGYTRMKTAFLRDMPVPLPGKRANEIAAAVRAAVSRRELDVLIEQAYR